MLAPGLGEFHDGAPLLVALLLAFALDWLIGDPDTQPERYVERSPLAQAERIRTPVIFFQGLRDAVVLPSQTEQMVAALDDNGVPVHCVTFADERHGFRQAAHLAQVLEEELAFYQAWL